MLPAAIKNTLENTLGKVVTTAPVAGGDISNAVRVDFADGRQALIKWLSSATPGMFTAEGRGLELLRSANALRVPQALAQQESSGDCPAFIAIEWLGRGFGSRDVDEALGIGLAQLHRATANLYGLDYDNFIGANPQQNTQTDNWVTFFAEQRLGYQMELTARNGYLNSRRRRLLELLLTRLVDLLPATPPASLLHGDLWGGNWIVAQSGKPALIDPAVYYGHREAELAFTELFGGFSSRFYDAYNNAWPLDSGYPQRKDLYNLYHLLNHLNLFGEGYGGSVDSVLQAYAG